jgi:hypothetical protein
MEVRIYYKGLRRKEETEEIGAWGLGRIGTGYRRRRQDMLGRKVIMIQEKRLLTK